MTGQYTHKKILVHYEIDSIDINKNDDILRFFDHNFSKGDDNFFSTLMSIAPIFSPFLEDEVRMKITSHSCKQLIIRNNLKYTTLSGVQITNWVDSNK